MQNFRKNASSARGSNSYTNASHNKGADKRRELLPNLTGSEKSLITTIVSDSLYGQSSGLSEADTYLVFVLECQDKGKRSSETDTCPFLEATSIASLKDRTEASTAVNRKFLLPLIVCHDPEWTKEIPGFHQWLISACYFPELSYDGKSLEPGSGSRTVSDLDIFRMYVTAIYFTLQGYWKKPTPEKARLVLLLNHTLNYFKKGISTKIKAEKRIEMVEDMAKLLKERDTGIGAATKYIQFEKEVHPSDYYWGLFNLLEYHTRQQTIGLWNLLLGVLSQDLLEKQDLPAVTPTGIEDHWLRLVWERISPSVPEVNCNECFTESDLIRNLHEKAGVRAENYLKQWAFTLAIVKNVLTSNFYNPLNPLKIIKAAAEMSRLQRDYSRIQGITTASLAISPTLDNCLSDKSMAEVILTASGRNRKTQELLDVQALFDPHAPTPLFTKLLNKNINDAKKIVERNESIIKNLFPVENTDTAAVLGHCMDAFKPPSVGHIFASGNTRNYVCALVNIVSKESEQKNLAFWHQLINQMIKEASRTGLLGERRSKTVLRASMADDSYLRDKYLFASGEFTPSRHVRYAHSIRSADQSGIFKKFFDESSWTERKQEPEEPIPNAQYVPVEEALIAIASIRKAIDVANAMIEKTCPICMGVFGEETGVSVSLHENIHLVCSDCHPGVIRTRKCPLCRKAL